MTDSLSDILGKRQYSEPPEVAIIKEFVKSEIGETPKVSVSDGNFYVLISSSAAAGNLRFKLFQLQRSLGHAHKIIIRVQ